LARLVFADYRRGHHSPTADTNKAGECFSKFTTTPLEETYCNSDFTKSSVRASESIYASKTAPNMEFNRRLGNMYTASLYAQLTNLVARSDGEVGLDKSRLLLYSYGGGYEAGMYSMRFNLTRESMQAYRRMVQSAKDALSRLESRDKYSPDEYAEAMVARDKLVRAGAPHHTVSHNLHHSSCSQAPPLPHTEHSNHHTAAGPASHPSPPVSNGFGNHHDVGKEHEANNNHVPIASSDGSCACSVSGGTNCSTTMTTAKTSTEHFPGTYYLTHIDEKWVRHYRQVAGD